MRGMKHAQRDRAQQAAADRRMARVCTATMCGKEGPPSQGSDCGGFEARVTLPGITAAFAARSGIGTHAAAARPTGLPIRILQLAPAAHLYLSPDDTVSTTSA